MWLIDWWFYYIVTLYNKVIIRCHYAHPFYHFSKDISIFITYFYILCLWIDGNSWIKGAVQIKISQDTLALIRSSWEWGNQAFCHIYLCKIIRETFYSISIPVLQYGILRNPFVFSALVSQHKVRSDQQLAHLLLLSFPKNSTEVELQEQVTYCCLCRPV